MTALELIKSRAQGAESLTVILDDREAQRVVAAWPMLGQRNIDRPLKKNETVQAATQDLWSKAGNTFTQEELADQADVPVSRCLRIFTRLIRAGLVYPDGTISKPATDLLYGRAMGHIRGMMFPGTKRKTNG